MSTEVETSYSIEKQLIEFVSLRGVRFLRSMLSVEKERVVHKTILVCRTALEVRTPLARFSRLIGQRSPDLLSEESFIKPS